MGGDFLEEAAGHADTALYQNDSSASLSEGAVGFAVAFFAGLLVAIEVPAFATTWVMGASALVCGIALLGLRRRRRSLFKVTTCGACVGFLFGAINVHQYLENRWSVARTGERVIASVRVDSIPAPREAGWAFEGRVDIESPARWRGSLRARIVEREGKMRPHVGERWRMLLALRPPRGHANPGTPDFERQLFRNRVHALGTVVASQINQRIDGGHHPLDELREAISAHIHDRVADRDAAALIAALAVGDTGRVSQEQWRIFNSTGTTHLVAISGLHVTLFAVVALALARRSWSVLARVAGRRPGSFCVEAGAAIVAPIVRWPREIFAAVAGFGAATAYACLAGLSVPTLRTLIMLGVWLFARASAHAVQPFRPFWIALVAVLILDPFAPLAAGFWLSFAAMAVIIVLGSERFARRPAWREALAVQVVVTLALAPFTMALFGAVSAVSPVVNLIAIPAMSWVLVPAVLLSLVLMPVSEAASNGVLSLAAWIHDLGWAPLARAADASWALIHPSPPLWWYLYALLSLVMARLPAPPSLRVAALVCAALLAASRPAAPARGDAQITILDVGEGTSVIVRTAHHALVYGTGESYATDGRIVDYVLAPFLRHIGVRNVDVLLLGRPIGIGSMGVTALYAQLPVRSTFVADEGVDDIRSCASISGPWQWDGVTFEVLTTPAANRDVQGSGARHLQACVLSVRSVGGSRVLVAADLDAGAEQWLVRRYHLRADLIVIPRSGADTASLPAFVDAVSPRWAVVSGRREQGGRAKRALARWERRGARVLATAETGAVSVRLTPERGMASPTVRRKGVHDAGHG